MTYADELDDRDAASADLTALLAEDPADWPAAQHCPTHGWWVPRGPGADKCGRCFGDRLAARMAPAGFVR